MRTRLSKTQRRACILDKARKLFLDRGFSNTDMEDIRLSCGISRGGLYHHFPNKRAVLAALVEDEVLDLVDVLEAAKCSPFTALLRAASSHLGSAPGMLSALSTEDERLDYLSSLERAFATHISRPLSARLQSAVLPIVDANHIAELFLTITAHINRREILGQWNERQAAGFAATSLRVLATMLRDPADLDSVISDLERKSVSS